MTRLTIASKNEHKIQEFRDLLEPWNVVVTGLAPTVPPSPEGGSSFEANAMEKAVYYSTYAEGFVLADDSGLAVDALSGQPGVLSARYAGSHGDDAANRAKLLRELAAVPKVERTASFACALALFDRKQGFGLVVRADVNGLITLGEMGEGGFGYDPLFYVPSVGKTFAQMSADEKNRLSHRAKAVETLMQRWKGEA